MAVYHKSSQTQSRTRPATWVPRRVYYVLAYLKRALAPGKSRAISNRQIQEAIRFGSEGEVSQIMRWLAGEAPTAGRWAYGVLRDNEQRYQFIDRERMPSGGYVITLLLTPRPIAPAVIEPQIVQLSLFENDPFMIPPAQHQDASRRGSFSDIPDRTPDRPLPARQNACSQGDHAKETHEDQQQQRSASLENSPLFQRLMSDPDMNKSLAMRVVTNAPGTLADFLADLAAAPRGTHVPPLFWVASIWATGKRPKARDTAPRHAPIGRAVPLDNRPQLAYYTPPKRDDVLTPEQRRAKLAALGTPDWAVKAGTQ